jgi:AraC family transcriptional regulator
MIFRLWLLCFDKHLHFYTLAAAMNQDYIKSVNRILAFIDQNIDEKLSLETVAEVGNYSPFHLHRIFKAITSETLNAYINRKRIEKAAAMLLHRKELSIATIYLKIGFTSNSSFTRTFSKYYEVSPTEFRSLSTNEVSKICKTVSKIGQSEGLLTDYICSMNELKNWINSHATIEIKEMPIQHAAFITQIGVDGLPDAFNRLVKWAMPKGLMQSDAAKLGRIYHDSFKITAPEKVRMSVCLLLEAPIAVDGEIGLTNIKAGKFIVGSFVIEPKDFGQAWRGLYQWMNEKGYQKADQNPFEIYHNNFNEHPEQKSIVDLYIPIN